MKIKKNPILTIFLIIIVIGSFIGFITFPILGILSILGMPIIDIGYSKFMFFNIGLFLGLLFFLIFCISLPIHLWVIEGKVKPIERELTVGKSIREVKSNIITQLEIMKGKIIKSDKNYIECDLGSLLRSRLIGEFWVSKNTLPKKVEIRLELINKNETKVKIFVRETHKYGLKTGYVKKYEQALQEVSDSIIAAIK